MECKKCHLCCELFEIKEIQKPSLILCKYYDENFGCTIHKNKPLECKNFNCMYTQMKNVSENFRPDNLGIIFEKLSSTLIFGTLMPNYNLNNTINRQIDYFLKEGFSVAIFSPDKRKIIFPSLGKTIQDVENELKKHLLIRYGSTNVYM